MAGKPLSATALEEMKQECTERDLRLADTLLGRAEKFAPNISPRSAKEIKSCVETARMLRGFHSKTDLNVSGSLTVEIVKFGEAKK